MPANVRVQSSVAHRAKRCSPRWVRNHASPNAVMAANCRSGEMSSGAEVHVRRAVVQADPGVRRAAGDGFVGYVRCACGGLTIVQPA